jgi:leukotriene-A4 hydrolase
MTPDPHSFARPLEARVTHLSLDITLDFAARRLHGQVTLDLAVAPGAREVVLDSRGLAIEEVTGGGGAPLSFTLGPPDPLFGSALTVALPPGTERIAVRYAAGADADALQWLAPEQTAGGEHPYLFTQGHAILTRTWLPTQDSPGIRQTYDARVTVPRPLSAVMSAEHLGPVESPAGDARVLGFRMREPLPPHLIALAAGDLAFRATGPRTGVFAEPSVVERAAWEFADLERMMDAAEAIGGRYLWERFDVVVMPPSFPYGGMENPRLTFASPSLLAGDRSLTTVVAHELAHAWAGNLVTNATWDDFWLNEGITVYVELRMNEALWGSERAGMLRTHGWRELSAEVERQGATSPDTRLHYDMRGRDPSVGVTVIPYLKGASFLWAVEQAVGRERFDRWLRGWFERRAFTSVTTEHLLGDLAEHLFGVASWREAPVDIEQWVFQPGLPAEAAPPLAPALAKVDASASAFQAGAPAASLGAAAWSPQEWRHFLGTLLGELPAERLADLDAAFALSSSANAEVLFAWLRLAARNRYAPALPAIERFLRGQGRGKYLRPLYTELLASEWGAAVARSVYKSMRNRYHALVRTALDRLLEKAGR